MDKQELVKAKQAQILRAAQDLFAKKGYHKTSVRDIAKSSGMSVGSLYDYIKNKEDILYLLGKEFLDNLQNEVDKVLAGGYGIREELEGTVKVMLKLIDRYQEYTLFAYRDSKYLKKEHLKALMSQDDYFTETFTSIIKKGIDKGIFETQEAEIVSIMLTMMTHTWALKRYILRKYPFFIFEKTLLRFLLCGLQKDCNE